MSLDIISRAAAPASDELVPSRYALRVGEIDVLVVSDGVLPLPTATLATNVAPTDLATWLDDNFQFRVGSPAERSLARSEVLDLVYRHCRSAGVLLAMPPESAMAMTALPAENATRSPSFEPIELIEGMPIFATLTHEEKLSFAEAASAANFARAR